MNVKEELLEIFKQNKGFISSDSIFNTSQRYCLSKMLKTGEISRIKKGLYVLNNHEDFDEKVLVSKMYPQAIFCLFSAWEHYHLTTSIPSYYYLALSRKTKVSKSNYPPVQIHYWSDASFNLGIVNIEIDKQQIKIYDIEKSVCDAIKNRAKIGEDITIEILKNYLKAEFKNIDKLTKYADKLRIKKVLEQYIKPLL